MKEKKRNIFLLLFCVALGLSCSTGRNTSSSRAYHELKTRYNIFHNAQEAYNNLIEDQLTSFPENRFELLSFYPTSAVNEKKIIGGPFDAVVDKVEKAIIKHSISAKPKRDPAKAYSDDYRKWLKQEEFNPFMKHVWLILGKAHVQNGDYDLALPVFSEMLKIFPDDIDLTSEVQLCMLRTYSEMNRFYDAQNIIIILQNRNLKDDLNKLFTETYTHYLLESKQFHESLPFIRTVIDGEKNLMRKKRLQFLIGQVYTILADYDNADKAFEELKGIYTPKELRVYADYYQDAFSAGKHKADSVAHLLRQNLFNEDINTPSYSDSSEPTHLDTPAQNAYTNPFILYWDAHLKRNTNNTLQASNPKLEIEREYITDNFSPHIIILSLSDQSESINELLFYTANFNYSNFKLRTFDITQVILNKRAALKLEPFGSLEDALNYLQLLRTDSVYHINLASKITPIIISNENFNILQNHSTLEKYNMFYEAEIGMKPENIIPKDLLQLDAKIYNKNIEESLSLKPDSINESPATILISTDLKTSGLLKPSDLKSSLEQKAAEMMRRTEESTSVHDRAKQIKEREQLRKERIKQREKELKERERRRAREVNLREKERERRIRNKREHK